MDIKLTRLNILETQSVLLRRCARESVHRLFVTTDSGNEKRLSFYRYETKSEFRMISTSKLTKRIYIYIRRKLRGYRKNESG